MDKAATNKKKIIFIVIIAVIDVLLLALLLSFLIIKSVRGLEKAEDSLYMNRADRFNLSEMVNIDDCFDKYNRAFGHQYTEKALVKCAKAIVAERENNMYVVTGHEYDVSAGQCTVFMRQFLGGDKIAIVVDVNTCGLISEREKNNEIQQFNVNDYQFYVNNYPSDECLGSISSASDAAAKAETIWLKIYGKRIKKEKPYQIFFDENNKVWLIHGTASSDSFGGVAYILMDNDTGKVLAVWHDK